MLTNKDVIKKTEEALDAAKRYMASVRIQVELAEPTRALEDLINAQGEALTAMSWMIKLSASL